MLEGHAEATLDEGLRSLPAKAFRHKVLGELPGGSSLVLDDVGPADEVGRKLLSPAKHISSLAVDLSSKALPSLQNRRIDVLVRIKKRQKHRLGSSVGIES